jgi:predicted transcriptional regulator
MSTLAELTAEIVSSHASNSAITSEELIKNITVVFNTLKALEAGEAFIPDASPIVEVPAASAITIKQAYKNKDVVLCMVCGKGFKTLKKHLAKSHNLKTGEYRKQYSIPATKPLSAKSYVESRKQMALDRGQGEILAAARAKRKLNLDIKKAAPVVDKKKPAVKTVKVDAPVAPKKEKVVKAPTVAKKAAAPKAIKKK